MPKTIRVNKEELIEKIKQNKDIHIKEYEEAVIAYRVEAEKQLKQLLNDVKSGELDIKLNLVKPINTSKNYDDLIEMFKWEVNEIVELEYHEFRQYVQDETDFARVAKLSNMNYI